MQTTNLKQATNDTDFKTEGKVTIPYMRKGISVLYGGFRRWAREPLLHFLLIGAALFVIYHWLNPTAINSHTSQRVERSRREAHLNFEEVDISQIKSQWLSAQRAETKHELLPSLRFAN